MNRRKWPIYSMSVGQKFFVAHPSKCTRRNLYQRAIDCGRKLCIYSTPRPDGSHWLQVTRII